MIHPIKHFQTITRHRKAVYHHCVKVGIPLQGLCHDLSKYNPKEFFCGVLFFQGDKSPNVRERELFGFSRAWLHHKGRNKHHFEYWTDYDMVKRQIVPIKMPLRYLKEMFCDRVAASKIYRGDQYENKDPYQYFISGHARESMHPTTARYLETWLRMLAEEGEEVTFAHIRAIKEKDYE